MRTGWQKCRPPKRPAFASPAESRPMGIVEVFDVQRVRAASRPSKRRKSSCLAATFSAIASITRSHRATAASSLVRKPSDQPPGLGVRHVRGQFGRQSLRNGVQGLRPHVCQDHRQAVFEVGGCNRDAHQPRALTIPTDCTLAAGLAVSFENVWLRWTKSRTFSRARSVGTSRGQGGYGFQDETSPFSRKGRHLHIHGIPRGFGFSSRKPYGTTELSCSERRETTLIISARRKAGVPY